MNCVEEILAMKRNDYQKDNFDSFLAKVKFTYDIPSVHIAGTNGKGGTATFLNDIYIANGYKVGLFTSPDDFLEMIKVNNKPIEIEFVEKFYKENRKLFDKYDLSCFEIQTYLAFEYFKAQKVDIAIIECGMGGEYDATNIFTPILSIITSISIEHSEFLGVSLSEIAEHKCGIIKDTVPTLISSSIQDDALTVVVNNIKEKKSKLTVLDQHHNIKYLGDEISFDYRPYENLKIKSHSEYRIYDACMAIEASNILKEQFPVEENKLKEGLLNSFNKCRFEVLNTKPIIILDGAHNFEAINKLRKDMDRFLMGKRCHIVFAAFRDKNIALEIPEISLLGKINLTTFDHPRVRNQDDYFLYLDDYPYFDDCYKLMDSLLENEEFKEDVILVTGSLAFTYEMRRYLKEKKNV